MVSLFKTCCLLVACLGTTNARFLLIGKLSQIPATFSPSWPDEPPQLVKLSIRLEPENHDELERTLFEISDPEHHRYGKHLTRDEANALLQPSAESVHAVKRWLADTGIPDIDITHQGPLIHAHVDAEQAQFLLQAPLDWFAHGSDVRRSRESLPEHVKRHVAYIQTRATPIRRRAATPVQCPPETPGPHNTALPPPDVGPVNLEKCKATLTPACLRELYHLNNYHAKPHPKSLLGVAGFECQSAQFAQLEDFLRAYAPYAAGANFSVQLINGGENTQGEYASGEANLDIQYVMSMAHNIPVRYYSTGGLNFDYNADLDVVAGQYGLDPLEEFINYFLDLQDAELPQVLTISYGANEQHVPKAHASHLCDLFGKLGTRGVSVIVASGDSGPGASCQTNDGKNTTRFLPTFPASCPYVTAVGGTVSNSPEAAYNQSSGGFSEYFPRPTYQDEAVKSYLREHGAKWEGYYNPQGRGIPDVSAQALNLAVINHDTLQLAEGTSGAAPVLAALIALLNNQRLNRGKPPLGFLNPWLYSIGHLGFTDITVGKSEGCTGESMTGAPSPVVRHAGWDAVPGWDPATGIGTPLFDRLASLACR